jgi:transposase
VKKAYLYRLYPREEQAALLQQQLDVAREVYNACLLERREAYHMAGVTLNYYAQANQLKALPRGVPGDRADIAAVNFSMLQAICRRAQRAYESFFRRVKASQPAGFPRFKSKVRFNSITCPSYGDGCKLSDTRLYCGEPVPKDLGERWHHCPRCGLSLPRDQVSAMLIKALGLEMLANNSGLGSSPQAPTWPAGACVA